MITRLFILFVSYGLGGGFSWCGYVIQSGIGQSLRSVTTVSAAVSGRVRIAKIGCR